MKPIHGRLYTPPRTRSLYTTAIANVNPSQPRPVRSHPSLVFPAGQHQHISQPTPSASLYYTPYLSHPTLATIPAAQSISYELEIGGYGIPKKAYTPGVASSEASLAVSVGEDAYFIRDNALGVADGVGGWSRNRASNQLPADSPTASALFAKRLMHYCSDELAQQSSHEPEAALNSKTEDWDYDLDHWEDYESEWGNEEEPHTLSDHLDDLSEGIDVLHILERAYNRTIAAHVVPPEPLQSEVPPSSPKPLMSGSSTALFAVLDPHVNSAPSVPRTLPFLNNIFPDWQPPTSLRILHLGDSSALLVRNDSIVWRSQEMWLDYNTPAQLGPTASPFPHHNEHRLPGSPYTDSGRPSYAPRLHTIPAYPNDILILASDGLSDNLWDAEILDEVTRVRQSLGFSSAASLQSWPWSELGNGTQELTSKLRMSAFPTILAEALTSRAHRRIHSRQKAPFPSETPFTARARAAGKPVPKGGAGKNDDITVLVAVVCETVHKQL